MSFLNSGGPFAMTLGICGAIVLHLLLTFHDATGLGLDELTNSIFGARKSKITICNSLDCEYSLFMDDDNSSQELLVYFPTVNLQFDPYVNHFLGLVLDLFELTDNVHVVISSFSHFMSEPINSQRDYYMLQEWQAMDCNEQHHNPITQAYSIEYCQELKIKLSLVGRNAVKSPRKTALVSIQDAPLAVDISALTKRSERGLEKPLFLHLNDEMPWNRSDIAIQSQVTAYQQAFHVFRTVFYDGFQPFSSYIPVRSGALVTSSFLTPLARKSVGYHSAKVLSQVSLSSARPVLCSFAGGLKYSHLGGTERDDRVAMIEAFRGDTHCDLFVSDNTTSKSHKLNKSEYIELMRGTVFVLCPAGLNPETFRLHETLELGAIPLTLRVSEPEQDYLSEWVDYPGPLFDSWAEARLFVQAVAEKHISLTAMDVLQEELRDWYQRYLLRSRVAMRDVVINYMLA